MLRRVYHEDLQEPVWLKQDLPDRKNVDFGTIKRLPIVFTHKYTVKFGGLEKLHPFDSAKAKNIMKHLYAMGVIDEGQFYEPENEITNDELLKVHTPEYIRSLRWSINVAKITENPLLMFVPNSCVQRSYLRPMRYQTAGTLLAGKLALKYGCSINFGGGFHHCSGEKGRGFCPFADITLLISKMFEEQPNIKTAMIVDLDAHQGNGYARDFKNNYNVYIVDMYNCYIYPRDYKAKLAINCPVELKPYTRDHQYLRKLQGCLAMALEEFKPNFVVYNAGTDILEGDPLGMMSITPEGVIQRDEMVIRTFRSSNVPVAMLLSGGYTRASAYVIADSITNLIDKGLIDFK